MKKQNWKKINRLRRNRLVWHAMISRCREESKDRKHYFDKGITVCSEWKEYGNFLKDMGERPFEGAEIDRINNNLGYYKDNCRWATRSVQCHNKKSVRTVGENLPRGVYKRENSFRSCIGINGRLFHLGSFRTSNEAYLAYSLIEKEWYGCNYEN